jgi:hypothetical protein
VEIVPDSFLFPYFFGSTFLKFTIELLLQEAQPSLWEQLAHLPSTASRFIARASRNTPGIIIKAAMIKVAIPPKAYPLLP